jgi:hypothetical protein
MPPQHTGRYRTVAGAVGVVVLMSAGALVQVSGVGIDLLAVGVIAGVLLVLDRTVGDWLAEKSNSGVPNLLFAGFLAVLVSLLFLTPTGTGWIDRFLQFGEERGYEGLWLRSHAVVASEPAAGGSGGSRNAASGSARTSAGSPPPSVQPSSRPRVSGRSRRPGVQPGAAFLGSPEAEASATGGESATAGSPAPMLETTTAGSHAAVADSNGQGGGAPPRGTKEPTSTVVNVTPRRARPGEDVAAVAVVTRAAGRAQSGRVEFSVNGALYSSASITADGAARVVLKGLGPGLFSIGARFMGSTDLLPSSSTVQLTIQND